MEEFYPDLNKAVINLDNRLKYLYMLCEFVLLNEKGIKKQSLYTLCIEAVGFTRYGLGCVE